ncbi:MAG: 1-acyl-sn-glycerol-3-phosphate acyltransferase [Clostridiaceae bacterium]|jgi:1-acyl-sn-glycerol-3-phosphate acyltransferase|nr:1-acyl-sn-glycerol-3-phosphate acyltransferase [Clostridiaceae bacterium]
MTERRSKTSPKQSLWLRFVNKVIRFLVRVLLASWYLPKVVGPRKPAVQGRAILFANHHHMCDPLFITLFYKTDRLSFVAKKELYSIPGVQTILDAFSSIKLDRQVTDMHAAKSILGALRMDRIVGLFMQGTRVNADDIVSVKPKDVLLYYAIRQKIPVILVGITPNYRLFGRPRFTFSDTLLMTIKNKNKLTRDEQTSVGYEVMRQIYELAGLSYEPADIEEHRAVFEREIQVRPYLEGCEGEAI